MISQALIERIEEAAENQGCTPADLVEGWISTHSDVPANGFSTAPKRLLDHLHDKVLLVGPENRIKHLNQTLLREYAVKGDEWRERPLSELLEMYLSETHIQQVLEAITEIRSGEADDRQLEIPTCGPDHSSRIEKIRICPLTESKDELALIGADVTGYRETKRQLQDTEVLFRRLTEQLPVAISIIQDGRLVYVNAAFEELTGYSATEVKGSFAPLRLIHPEDRPIIQEEYNQLPDGEPISSVRQLRIVRKDEAVRTVRIYRARVPYAGTSAVLTVCTDMTEQLRASNALRAAKEEAEQADAMKATLLANMSHEFRTPLASVVGFADLLASEVSGPHQRFVQMIRESGERLLETLESVLDLAQLEGQELELQPEELNAADLLKEVVRSLEPEAQQKGVPIQVQIQRPVVRTVTDRSALSRVAAHLLSNAVKFTDDGAVTVSLRVENENLVLTVSDEGVGVAPERQTEIFRPFYQESQGLNREFNGTGLGLAITQRLVDLLGGSIELSSESNVGTSVTVHLPREIRATDQVDEPTRPRDDCGLDQLPEEQCVLLLDDERNMRELARQMLPSSYVVQTAADPGEAFDLLEQEAFDVVLLDIDLGGEMDGTDVLERLRTMDTPADPLVIAMTAYGFRQDRKRVLQKGFDGYLTKPFTRKTLRSELITVRHDQQR